MVFSQAFLLRTAPDGRREASWRVWMLIWLLPAAFALAGLAMLVHEAYRHIATVPGEGEVVRVYEWQGDTPFDRGKTLYGPVFRYVWSDGEPTEATSGTSSPDWNFPIGTVMAIRYFPGQKADIVLPGRHNWLPGLTVAALALVFLPFSLIGHRAVRRWLNAGGAA